VGFVKLSLLPVVLGLGMTSLLRAQVPPDCPKVVIDDVDLQGAIHLPESVREQLQHKIPEQQPAHSQSERQARVEEHP
jgi:hypothetical protein